MITSMSPQIKEELDLILLKKGLCKKAATDWSVKWTPAILRLSKTLRGKQLQLYKQYEKSCEGGFTVYAYI